MVLELLAEKDVQVNLLWLMFVPHCSFLDHFAYICCEFCDVCLAIDVPSVL